MKSSQKPSLYLSLAGLTLLTAIVLSACVPITPTVPPEPTQPPASTATTVPTATLPPTATSMPSPTNTPAAPEPTMTSAVPLIPKELSIDLPKGVVASLGKGILWGMAYTQDYVAVSTYSGVAVYALPAASPLWAQPVPGGITALAYFPDGKLLAGKSQDSIILWDSATGEEIKRSSTLLEDFFPVFYGLAFSSDGKLLAASDASHNILTWNMTSPQAEYLNKPGQMRGGGGGGGGVTTTAFKATSTLSPDNSILLYCDGLFFYAWDLGNNALLWDMALWNENVLHSVTTCGFTPDGKAVYGAGDQGIQFYNPADGKLLSTLPDSENTSDAAYSPDGKSLYSNTSGPALLDTDGKKTSELSIPSPLKFFFFNDQTGLAFYDTSVLLFNLADGSQLAKIDDYSTWFNPQYLKDGNTLALFSDYATAHFFNRTTNTEANVWKDITTLSPDGMYAVREKRSGDTLSLQVMAANQEQPVYEYTVPADAYISQTLFSPDGKALALVSSQIDLIDLSTQKALASIPLSIGENMPTAAFSPDGKTLAASNGLAHYTLFDTTTGEQLQEVGLLQTPLGAVTALAFSPDGKQIAVGLSIEGKGSIMLVEPQTGQEITSFQLPGDYNTAYSLAFSPDGKTLAANGSPFSLWDTATGQPKGELPGCVDGYSFSPDSATLAASNCNGVVLFYDLALLSR